MSPMRPALSVIVASFGVREPSWERLRSCLKAVAEQDINEIVEVVLCEMNELRGEVPEDIRDMAPGLLVVECQTSDPCARKTLGVQNASAPIVAFLDADCMPQAGWARSILETFQYYPEVAAVRGAMAGEKTWLQRLLPQRREAGPCRSTAETNVAFRREAYLEYPLAPGGGAVRLQTEAMRRARYVLWSEPTMQVLRDRRGLKQAAGAQVDYSPATR